MAFYHRDSCRLCSSANLVKVLSLASTPPANAFVSKNELDEKQDCFPLELWFCRGCSHLQLLDIVAPDILFSDYVYVSGTSSVFVKHFENYASTIINYAELDKDSLVVDIGSNDGTLLRCFKDAGFRVLGIDPAAKIAEQATKSGIETIHAFFNKEISEEIKMSFGQADVITANNVFAHIDNLEEVISGVYSLLKNDAIFVFEVSYLLDMYEKTLFDMIYHEHLDYHSVQPLMQFFKRYNMEIIKAERVNTHGGSLRCYVQKTTAKKNVDSSVCEFISMERKHKWDDENTFISFAREIKEKGQALRSLLSDLKSSGKRIAGFGAPAKATTLMYHFGIDENDISFIIDDSPIKQGLYSPGLHIPVLPASAIEEFKPDYLLILAWNFADSIVSKNKQFLNDGGQFIIPLPELKII